MVYGSALQLDIIMYPRCYVSISHIYAVSTLSLHVAVNDKSIILYVYTWYNSM